MVTTALGLCSQMRKDVAAIWDKIYAHPFLKEVENDTLPERKLKFFFMQNYQFIDTAVQFYAIAAGKAPDRDAREFCLGVAAKANEKMHEQMEFVERLSGDVPREMAPANFGYTRHLLTQVHQGGTLEVLAAMLPCPWTYDDIGHAMHPKLRNPVTRQWLEWWASDEHADLVEHQQRIINRLSEGVSEAKRTELGQAFRISSLYEYMFWDMAYYEQSWPM